MTGIAPVLLAVHRIVRGLLLAAGLSVPSVLAVAQAPPAPRATVAGTPATFLPPLGLWDADRHAVRMIFLTTPLPPADEAAARRDGEWPVDGVGPAVTVDFAYAEGKYSGDLADLEACTIGFHAFRGAPPDISGTAADCHVVSTGGRLQPGGMLIGLLQGAGTGYDVRLPFSVMFPAAATGAPAAAAAPAPVVPVVPVLPSNTVVGHGTFTGRTLTVTAGLAWVNGEKFEVALFDHPPRPGILAELRTGSWGEGGPIATLTFMLDTGTPGPAAVSYCYVNLSFPKGGSMGVNANEARRCGLTAIGGELRAGGHITATLAGSAPMRDDAPMAWDLRFNLPLSK